MKKRRVENYIGLLLWVLVLSGCESYSEEIDLSTSVQAEEQTIGVDATDEIRAASAEDPSDAPISENEYPPLDLTLLPDSFAPCGLALDGDALLIADSFSKKIWRLSPEGAEVYAGADSVENIYGEPLGGYNDAPADEAFFKSPWAITPFLEGFVVSDTENYALRLIREGRVETVNAVSQDGINGEHRADYSYPTGLATDPEGNIYVSDTHRGSIGVINPAGQYHTFLEGLEGPMGLACNDGYLYIAETGKNRILRAEIADPYNDMHFVETVTDEETFSSPMAIAVSSDGTIFVADTVNGLLRRIRDGQVTTIEVKSEDAPEAVLTSPMGVCIRGSEVYIADNFTGRVFVIPYE